MTGSVVHHGYLYFHECSTCGEVNYRLETQGAASAFWAIKKDAGGDYWLSYTGSRCTKQQVSKGVFVWELKSEGIIIPAKQAIENLAGRSHRCLENKL